MFNNFWSTQMANHKSYRQELHKRLVANYNRRITDDMINSIGAFDCPKTPDIKVNTDTRLPGLMWQKTQRPSVPHVFLAHIQEPETHTEIDSSSSIIQVKYVEFHIQKDSLEHHTDMFETMQEDLAPAPIFRRGQSFSVTVQFNRDYKPKEDFIHIVAEYGPKPSISNGTFFRIALSEKEPKKNDVWEVLGPSKQSESSEVTLQVFTPHNCQVGMWRFSIITFKTESQGNFKYNFPEDIFILFNPWNRDDDVYMESEQERKEYVLNDHGKIWMGTNRAPTGYHWVFGQFDPVVLPAMVLLLEQSDLPHADRGSAVLVARALSAVINSFDDNGLLVGKWKDSFDDGTNPFTWTGSVGFFEEYLKTGRPIKYAQCWVFSGAITTACRVLGIPCRAVTCYVCAHDTNNSLTVDKFFSKDGKLLEGGADGDCYDSTWNFHCWNDVWMARPDLPPGYGGWQALDGTPQEESNYKYRTGPTSLRAIKQGNVGLQYDTGFVFSEVNADLCHFQEDNNSSWGFTRIKLDPAHIGKRIVTQSVVDNLWGERGMEEITHLYKNAEGSEAERASVFNALKGHAKAQKYYKAVSNHIVRDVFFKLKEVDVICVGDSFPISLTIENHSSTLRTIKANLTAISVLYTGKIIDTIKEGDVEVSLRPKEAKTVRIVVMPEDYMTKIGQNLQLKMMGVASVVETKQNFSVEDDFEIIKLPLNIKMPRQIKLGHLSEVNFSFTNPFIKHLTNCELTIEGPGLQRPKTVKLSDVPPNGQIKHFESLVPKKVGARVLVATFNCDQLAGIKGLKTVQVES